MRRLGYIIAVLGGIAVLAFLSYPWFQVKDVVYRVDQETAVLQFALEQYKAEFGVFPSGDSRAICHALSGNNPKKVRFIEFRSVTPEGDFLDPWGTPYKIYYSGDRPLIRSAGPNKQFDSSTHRKQTDDYFRN